MKRILFAFFLFPLVVAAQDKLSESNYRIYSVKLGKEVSLKEIINDMDAYDVLFFGEIHNDSVDHFLERNILEMLYSKYGSQLTLSMEMFDRDVQLVMNEYLKGFIREKNFIKDARVWSNYRDYRPMVEFAKNNGMDVICANASTRYTNLAGRKGQQGLMELPDESKDFFAPLPYDTATKEYYDKLAGIPPHVIAASFKDTANKITQASIVAMGGFNMIMAQSLWDATMAYSISEYLKKHKGHKIMQVNGAFHSDQGFAVVSQLHKYRPKAKTLIISTACDGTFPNIKWDEYKNNGDYIIITDPKVPKTFDD